MLWRTQFNVLFSAPTKLFLSIQVCVKGYYKSMSRCTKCPTLPWLITQMVFIVCAIFLLIFILFRDESKTKGKGRTLSDVVLARLKIVVGFYQVYFNFSSFSLKLFFSLSLIGMFLHPNICVFNLSLSLLDQVMERLSVPSTLKSLTSILWSVTTEMRPLWLNVCMVLFISQHFTKRYLGFLIDIFWIGQY